MALSESDIIDIKDGFYELYDTFFSHQIEFLQFDEAASHGDDVYNERKYKKFLTAKTLIGKVELKEYEEQLKPNGAALDSEIIVTIPTKVMEQSGLINLDETLLKNSRMRYKSVIYEIVKIEPSSNINDIYLKYIFTCKKVK